MLDAFQAACPDGQGRALRSRHICVCISARPLACYLALGRLHNFSKLYFLMFKKEMVTAPTTCGCRGFE